MSTLGWLANFGMAGHTPLHEDDRGAGRVLRITRVMVSGTSSSAQYIDIGLILRSTQGTGGTFTSPTGVALDQNDPATTAFTNFFTANPTTLGTTIGTVAQHAPCDPCEASTVSA